MNDGTMHRERWFEPREGRRACGRPHGRARARHREMPEGARTEHGGAGRHGRRGWGRRGGRRTRRGDVRTAILMLLSEQPMHGYEVIQQISARSGGVRQPSPGSVYPALQMLEDQGLIQAEEAEGRRTFHLTDSGRAHVEQHRDELAAAWTAMRDTADAAEVELHELVEQIGMAATQVAHVGSPGQLASARTLLTTTRQQLYRILAEDGMPAEEQP